jgi:hypothetical protein
MTLLIVHFVWPPYWLLHYYNLVSLSLLFYIQVYSLTGHAPCHH